MELEAAVSELEAFSYTVSHDLKSPLRAIEGYSKIILEDYRVELDEDGSKMVSNIRNICSDMITMIGKLLQYSISARMDVCRRNVNISKIFTSVFTELRSIYSKRIIEFEFETGMPSVLTDETMLKQVIYNIISNAIKFTENREKAIIVAGCKMGVGEYIFYVKDNGVGIDMELLGKLFQIFQ